MNKLKGSNLEKVSSVKKTVQWTVFSVEPAGGYRKPLDFGSPRVKDLHRKALPCCSHQSGLLFVFNKQPNEMRCNLLNKEHIVTCKKYGNDYYYESTGNPWPGGKERETAYCPYCKADEPSEMISGFIYTYKLDTDGNPIQ